MWWWNDDDVDDQRLDCIRVASRSKVRCVLRAIRVAAVPNPLHAVVATRVDLRRIDALTIRLASPTSHDEPILVRTVVPWWPVWSGYCSTNLPTFRGGASKLVPSGTISIIQTINE